ncbi:MAG TPA: polyribonucleotide nucleotidyltransferase, partial [Anaerolineae bacterium]|nr:polyribonucleotide nucleotidyltransferase [Anaerolineae bacterium]
MDKPQLYQYKAKLGSDEIIFETGQLAGQAGGAIIVKSGDSMLLTTATAASNTRDIDFFPLSVEFEEKLYAAGRIPGSFFRREGRPSEEAILTARLTDRPLRPLFNKEFRNEVQIIITALSSDGDTYLDILAINSASAALTISDIPWDGPIGAVRIGLVNGGFVVNPTTGQLATSDLDLRVAGTEDAILMVEAGASEVPEGQMIEALRLAHESIQDIIRVQKEMREQVGKPKREFVADSTPDDIKEKILAQVGSKIEDVVREGGDKEAFNTAINAIRDEAAAYFEEDETVTLKYITDVHSKVLKKAVRSHIINNGIRPDGRDPKTVRPIWGEVGVLPRTHGSGIFTRGETQALTITTFGTPRDEQKLDTLGPQEFKRYMHHYNFP